MKNIKNLAVLGSTGSIGVNTLDVVRQHPKKFRVVGLSAHKNIQLVLKQIREFRPEVVSITDSPSAHQLKMIVSSWRHAPQIWNSSDGASKLSAMKSVDHVVCGMVGGAGLLPLISALKAGKIVGLANKEALIVAGEIIMALSKKHKAPVIPVDSEHSAIYQCLSGHNPEDVERIILTASGGPFYKRKGNLDKISVKEALNHPTWKMGAKITVDSATLMNKGLEAIEAHHLFGVPMDRIHIVIHPQSIVHSLVEFKDGAMIAQLSHPDMRLPIQYALTYPKREKTKLKSLRLEEVKRLDFAPPHFSRFPCLQLALKAGRQGGTAPTVLSASNEEAVQAFINEKISFMTIPSVVKEVLSKHKIRNKPTLDDVLSVDRWAREEANEIIYRKMRARKK